MADQTAETGAEQEDDPTPTEALDELIALDRNAW